MEKLAKVKMSKNIVMDGDNIEKVGKVGHSENSKSLVMDGVKTEKLEKLAKENIPRASRWMVTTLKS